MPQEQEQERKELEVAPAARRSQPFLPWTTSTRFTCCRDSRTGTFIARAFRWSVVPSEQSSSASACPTLSHPACPEDGRPFVRQPVRQLIAAAFVRSQPHVAARLFARCVDTGMHMKVGRGRARMRRHLLTHSLHCCRVGSCGSLWILWVGCARLAIPSRALYCHQPTDTCVLAGVAKRGPPSC